MKVQEIMSREVQTITLDAPVNRAIGQMTDSRVSTLIVDRRDQDDSYGILSRTDINEKVFATGADPAKLKVGDLATKPLVWCSPETDCRHALKLMERAKVHRLPVYDGKRIIGVVSQNDLFKAFARR